MISGPTRGRIYHCPVCHAEVSVLASSMGDFQPRCCGMAMTVLERRLSFYVCPVCGSEIAVLRAGDGLFGPRCCNTNMQLASAA